MNVADAEGAVLLFLAALAGLAAVCAVLVRNPVRGLYLYIFCSAILLSPELPVVRDKLSIAEPVLALTLAGLFFARARVGRGAVPLGRRQRAALAAGAAWVCVAGISGAVNFGGGRLVDWQRTVLEIATLGLGLVSCATIAWAINSWERWLRCLAAWSAGGLLVTLVGLFAMFVFAPAWAKDDFSGRVSATLRESGQVASYLGPVLPFAALAVERRVRSRWVKLPVQAVFLGAFVVMLGTGSRIALLISLTAFCGLVLALISDARRRGATSFFAAALVAGGAVGFGAFAYEVAGSDEKYSLGGTDPVRRPILMLRDIFRGQRKEGHRLQETAAPLVTAARHPLFGIGPGNYGVFYHQHEIHNSYLSVLGETGAFGVLTFAAFMVLTLRNGWEGWRALGDAPAGTLAGAFLFGFGLLLLYQMTALGLRQRPFWFAAGLMIALPRCAADYRLRVAAARRAARRR